LRRQIESPTIKLRRWDGVIKRVAMDPSWFVGEGWFAVAVAAMFFLVAIGTLLWLRGPGSRPHNPPVAHDRVRWFAYMWALFGALWLVRAVVGIGGFLVVCAVLLAMSVGLAVRTRLRRS
jgi:hypothetical protein